MKILFIIFGMNLKYVNLHSSYIVDKLKKLGKVYIYQDKIKNVLYYQTRDCLYRDINNKKYYYYDIDFDLSYVRVNTHIKMVYNNIKKKYKNIDDYKIIPIGYGYYSFLALYFSQIYKSKCMNTILLNSEPLIEEFNIISGYDVYADEVYNDKRKPITNIQFKKKLENLKNKDGEPNGISGAVSEILDICLNIRAVFIYKNLNLTLSVPTTSFINIENSTKDYDKIVKLNEVKILEKINPTNFKAIILKTDKEIKEDILNLTDINYGNYYIDDTYYSNQVIKYIYSLVK